MSDTDSVILAQNTVNQLTEIGINAENSGFLPKEIFDLKNYSQIIPMLILLSLGGFLVGFGTRYAGGCTSGHAITGLSQLQLGSLIAVIGFFIGGLIITHFVYPLIF